MSEKSTVPFGTYYLTVAQAYQEAVTNYSKLVELYPADRAGHGNLAVARFYLLDFARATESSRRALELYPSSLKRAPTTRCSLPTAATSQLRKSAPKKW